MANEANRPVEVDHDDLVNKLVIALNAAKGQLKIMAMMMRQIPKVEEAFRDPIHACEFQAGVAERALDHARKFGYDSD